MTKQSPTLLCILDGFGLNPNAEGNAITLAKTPTFDSLWENNSKETLTTFGPRVGLPEGQMGNSEVGHLNIGSGRVVEQWLVRIGRLLEEEAHREQTEYKTLLKNISPNGTLHLFGLFSDGGVHSHIEHLKTLVKGLKDDFPSTIALHLITDGRDTSPTLAAGLARELQDELRNDQQVSIATVAGRFYAMDRDTRWERIEEAYKVLAQAKGTPCEDPAGHIESCYSQDITDEFITPVVCKHTPIAAGDGLLFWNYRADRMRQLVRALCLKKFDGFKRGHPVPQAENVLCFTEYDASFGLPYLFKPQIIENYLGEVVSKAGCKQLRVAETEKYPHVTYFLNGGKEAESEGEERKLIPSPRDVKTYDKKPQMSAPEVTQTVVDAIAADAYDLIVVNFANCDMVGHTGSLEAAIAAVEVVDTSLGEILKALHDKNGQALIIADHGNAEQMINYETKKPHTAHTTYPVPVLYVGNTSIKALKSGGALCDVAPTILTMLKIAQPPEMTGSSLLKEFPNS